MKKKPVETTEETSLLKVLGNWDVLALGFGAMIGFGWVVLTGGLDRLRGLARSGAGDGRRRCDHGRGRPDVRRAHGGHAQGRRRAQLPASRHGPPRWSFVGSWGHRGRLRHHCGVRGRGSPENRLVPLSWPQPGSVVGGRGQRGLSHLGTGRCDRSGRHHHGQHPRCQVRGRDTDVRRRAAAGHRFDAGVRLLHRRLDRQHGTALHRRHGRLLRRARRGAVPVRRVRRHPAVRGGGEHPPPVRSDAWSSSPYSSPPSGMS